MNRVTLCKVFVHDQDEALDFYTKKLGFEVAEDNKLGDYRWLLVRLPDSHESSLNLDFAKSEEQSRPRGIWPTWTATSTRRAAC
jgi:catechol 2,3-dioxygenase-like lactoylglutathione lyase family enzyme